MPDFLLHLWAGPPGRIPVTCPLPLPGDPAATAPGFLDPSMVRAAYSVTGLATLAAALAVVLVCYLATRTTLGPRFVVRWYAFWGLAVALGLALPFAILRLWETRVYPGSCATNPTPFASPIPWSEVIERGAAGAVWAFAAFFVLSLLLTRTLGLLPLAGGLFHNRGCPVPRWRP